MRPSPAVWPDRSCPIPVVRACEVISYGVAPLVADQERDRRPAGHPGANPTPRSAPAPPARTGSGGRIPWPVRSCPSSQRDNAQTGELCAPNPWQSSRVGWTPTGGCFGARGEVSLSLPQRRRRRSRGRRLRCRRERPPYIGRGRASTSRPPLLPVVRCSRDSGSKSVRRGSRSDGKRHPRRDGLACIRPISRRASWPGLARRRRTSRRNWAPS